jgi:hypothetical protein
MSSNGNDTTPSEGYKEEQDSLVPTSDIQTLGATRLEKLTGDFENTVSEIENKSNYRIQEKQLTAYKKLLEEQWT